ncbi:MAG: MBL fold metallo-hydrolase [Bacteriovoracaceae bacterium]
MSKIIDAVSIILTCKDEIFLIEREHYLRAFPGYISFPGGKVEEYDADFLAAAIREGQEELGIDLGAMIKSGEVEGIDNLGVAITPDFNPYRFATHFMRFRLKTKPQMIVDTNEARAHYWLKASAIKEQFEKGELLAVPPIRKTCVDLGEDINLTTIVDLNVTYDAENEVPYIEPLKGMMQIMPLSHTLPPANRTNAFLVGDEHKVIIDPSPKDEEEYRKFKNTLLKFGVHEIFLTHHHPDHFEYSNVLARELNLPISLSEDTFQRIEKKHPGYFKDITLHYRKEGDVITRWLGQDVIVYEIPGHDEGQLALASHKLNWFLAGDLFQGIGTVVIGGEEGNMRKYMKTLERIITLSPKVIFPSHGIGLGGTYILKKTLEHRLQREDQIFKLHEQLKNEDEILQELYSEVNPKLYPYARQNIQKHLEKLKEDGRI